MTVKTRYSEIIHAGKIFLHSSSLPESDHLNPLVGPFPIAVSESDFRSCKSAQLIDSSGLGPRRGPPRGGERLAIRLRCCKYLWKFPVLSA